MTLIYVIKLKINTYQMNISIIGGNGIIGNGIHSILIKKKFKIRTFNSSIYNYKKKKYNLKKLSPCHTLILAGGVTEEEIKKRGFKNCCLRSTKSLLDLLTHFKKHNLKSVIYISSIRLKKSDNIDIKNNLRFKKDLDLSYRVCHLSSEKTIKKFQKKNKIKVLILRTCNTYGFPKNRIFKRKKLITFSFPMSMIKIGYIKLETSGKQIRYFCSNYEVGKKILKWIAMSKKKDYLTYNLFGKEKLSVLEFSKKCSEIYKKFKEKKIEPNRKKNYCSSLKNYLIKFYSTHSYYE